MPNNLYAGRFVFFPIKSIDWCLKSNNLIANDIDVVCYGFTNVNKSDHLDPQLVNRIKSYNNNIALCVLQKTKTIHTHY